MPSYRDTTNPITSTVAEDDDSFDWDGTTRVFTGSSYQLNHQCSTSLPGLMQKAVPGTTEEERLDSQLEGEMKNTKFPLDLEDEFDMTIKLKRETAKLWLEVDDLITRSDFAVPGKRFFKFCFNYDDNHECMRPYYRHAVQSSRLWMFGKNSAFLSRGHP
jgi:hypothetical protein